MFVLSGCAATAPQVAEVAPVAEVALLRDATPAELTARINGSAAKVVVVNAWATWCEPCKDELPEFLRFRRDFAARGVELVLISGDVESERESALTFLKTLGVDFETYRKTGGDMEFIEALHPEWSGSLPATIIFGAGGKREWFVEGIASYEQLERESLRVLGESP
jgi:thiol-disulfide isomerase/thioredoxin